MISERLLTPGQEGSDEALAIVRLLYVTTPAGGSLLPDICGQLAMSQTVAKAALKGLYSRGRVYAPMGMGWARGG